MSEFSTRNLPSKFYVYIYLHEDGIPYYVGKGKGARAWHKHSGAMICPAHPDNICIVQDNLNEHCAYTLEKIYISKYGRKVDNSGTLENLTKGGSWFSGYKHTPEHRAKISAANSKKISVEGVVYSGNREVSKVYGIIPAAVGNRARSKSYGSRNWWYVSDGYIVREKLTHSEETKKKVSAAKMGKKNPSYGKKYTDEERLKLSRSRVNKRAILVGDNTYASIDETARVFGIAHGTVSHRVRSSTERFKDWKYA